VTNVKMATAIDGVGPFSSTAPPRNSLRIDLYGTVLRHRPFESWWYCMDALSSVQILLQAYMLIVT
jgi:hypothetical protein